MNNQRRYKIPRWSKYNAGSLNPVEPNGGSWPLHFFNRNWKNQWTDLDGELVSFKIRNPGTIDFMGEQLETVKNTQKNLTDEQKEIANYFGFGPPTKQWTPVIDRLIDTYNVNPNRAARILAATNAAINDAMVIAWQIKYVTDVARPNQIDPELETVLPTPHFPAYPSGHAVVSGCVEVVLGYFFPAERARLREIAEQNALSRLYACVHFPIDNNEGLRLGRQIGQHIVKELKQDRDKNRKIVDQPYTEGKDAVLPPPPWDQAIPFPPNQEQAEPQQPARRPFFFF
ncbi:phosphatase PAP2 family protein [Anaerobacillus alkaliphilus]|uniref:Phosphatase PAP2 family protein n=1 Tax=Anaerobacillus alkaliphilus TaxID=1548597 RepID=A0A4Q0VUT2_9BACI|nr:vanadium-dependent haloperoxidase [Anaerobacillus alkaliphilus]RXJ02029.1 phosphatase PAP2 family protein [Anaerobacillus alkaliphilus]